MAEKLKRKPAVKKYLSHDAAMVELQKRANSYAASLRDQMRLRGISVERFHEIEPVVIELSKLMVALTAHLDGEK